MRALRVTLLAALLVILAQPTGAAGAGARPDPGFGAGAGFVTAKIPGTSALAYDALVLPNRKIVVAGQASTASGNGQIVVARLRRNGHLDRGFGAGGIVRTALPKRDGPFIATAVARQVAPHPKLLVAGGYGEGTMLALRLTRDGRLDRGFGDGRSGLVKVNAGGIANSLAILPDGRFLLGGSNANANGRPMVVARLSAGGALDSDFGEGGLAESMFWNPDLAASAGTTGLAATPGGGAIAAGHLDYIGSDGHGSAGVFELDADGQPGTAFGSGGHVEIAFDKQGGGFEQWFPCAMTVDPQGRITVTGDGSADEAAALLTTRLTAGGALDPAFGEGGRAVLPGLHEDSITTCGAALSAGDTITAGVGAALVQLTGDGTPNDSFAPGGLLEIRWPRRVAINAVAASGRRLVVAGSAGRAIYVARFVLPDRT